MPENAAQSKIGGLESESIKLVLYGQDIAETEMQAREAAKEKRYTYIPPYNHLNIISGQATIAIELEKQLEKIDAVLIPIGGGGLASGVAGYLKSVNGGKRIIGCQPQHSPIMYESVQAREIVEIDSLPTLSDGTAGGIEKGSITFEICSELIDDFSIVSEDEIKNAILLMVEYHQVLIEGAAALSIASLLRYKDQFQNQNVVLLITGNKISLSTLKEIMP